MIPGEVTLSVNVDLVTAQPQFTFTCISTGGPATTVTWYRGFDKIVGKATTVLDDPITAQYTHTLTVTGRLGEIYRCIVENNKPSIAAKVYRVPGKYT